MSRPILYPEVVENTSGTGRWMVLIFNNEFNSFDEVIGMLMKATGCMAEEAYIEAWEAHTYGKAPCHFAERTECEVVAAMISTIGVRTVVQREWEES